MAIESLKYSCGFDDPSERDMMSTPSAIASSNAARMSASSQPSDQHILYTAIRADGTQPRAVPELKPYRFAMLTKLPAAVDAVCEPCPSVSLGEGRSSGPNSPSLL